MESVWSILLARCRPTDVQPTRIATGTLGGNAPQGTRVGKAGRRICERGTYSFAACFGRWGVGYPVGEAGSLLCLSQGRKSNRHSNSLWVQQRFSKPAKLFVTMGGVKQFNDKAFLGPVRKKTKSSLFHVGPGRFVRLPARPCIFSPIRYETPCDFERPCKPSIHCAPHPNSKTKRTVWE